MEDRYKMLSNFIRNEMKITKEEMNEWLQQAITRQIEVRINRVMDSMNIQEVINANIATILTKNLGWNTKDAIRDAVIQIISKQVTVDIKQKV